MIAISSTRLRYTAYVLLAFFAAAAYLLPEAMQEQADTGTIRKLNQDEGLPQLRQLENAVHADVRRDLFAFTSAARTETLNRAEPAAAPAASASNPLSGVLVAGVVRRGASTLVLVRIASAPEPITVELGERFGGGNALSIRSVEGRKVTVLDNDTGITRTFMLSED
jgi:hypothetical protein